MPDVTSEATPVERQAAEGLDKSVPDPDTAHEDYASREFFFIPIPRHRRYHASKPFHFGLAMNIIFGLASTFTVTNLYWCQPILVQLALSFDTTYENISKVPTLAQAGYGSGLLLISPLGDLVKRRQLLLLLVASAGLLTIGLAVTRSVTAFMGLTFITSVLSVTPQVLLPLAADLAPDRRRATAMSIVLSGLMLGILVARVLGGIIAEYTSWRDIYWMAVGLQAVTLGMLYWTLPDYPRKTRDLNYFSILWTMVKFATTDPLLFQGSFMAMLGSALFSGYWVTLTFLLAGDPYNLSTLNIGLFGLMGIAGVMAAPFLGRFIDTYSPWLGVLIGQLGLIIHSVIYLGGAGVSIAVPIICAFFVDVFQQLHMTSNATRLLSVNPAARARYNAVLIIWVFFGQVMGTQASSTIFLRFGFRQTGAFWLGLMVLALAVHLTRGPNVKVNKLFGYEGGWKMQKRKKPPKMDAESAPGGQTTLELK